MLLTLEPDISKTYATLKPQASRASLRKKRIRKAPSGYVDLLYKLDIDSTNYVNFADLQVVSDNAYYHGCIVKIQVLSYDKLVVYGTARYTLQNDWYSGQPVNIGDVLLGYSITNRPFADILNGIIASPDYDKSATWVYIRISFDRESYYFWDRGFYILPHDLAPRLLLEISGAVFNEQSIFIKIESPLVPPSIQDIYLQSCDSIVDSFHIYVKSLAYTEQSLYVSSYKTYYVNQPIYIKSSAEWIAPTAYDGNTFDKHSWTEKNLIWVSYSGVLTSNMTLYFPHTDATTEDYYIDSVRGSDDYMLSESANISTPLASLGAFFDYGGGALINDFDIVHIKGELLNQLIFNFNVPNSSATTPVTFQSEDLDYTLFEGHLASDGSNRITSVVFNKIRFSPSTVVNSSVGGGTTGNVIYLNFQDPTTLDYTDPNYYVCFKECQFIIPGTFPNNVNAFIYFNCEDSKLFPKTIVFDSCLIGIDGQGLLSYFIFLTKWEKTRIIFRNCSFINPYMKNKEVPRFSGYPRVTVDIANYPGGFFDPSTSILYANCIFYDFTHEPLNSNIFVNYLRCFEGDPSLVNYNNFNPDFGKIATTSPCYRQPLPMYGNNIGWDQALPSGTTQHRTNIVTLGATYHTFTSNILTRIVVVDKVDINISAAFGKAVIFMDTKIATTFPEFILKLSTYIGDLHKTGVAAISVSLGVSYKESIDSLPTDILLLEIPKLKTEFHLDKEVIPHYLRTSIYTAVDTECPIVLKYGIPEWYEPSFGNTPYYYFDIYDRCSVDISSLVIYFDNERYKYGDRAIDIVPLKANKTAYRIYFHPKGQVTNESIHDIEISIYDCLRNKGPVWDNRHPGDIIIYENLTPDQKKAAMIPCFFTLYWHNSNSFIDRFNNFVPYVYDREWVSIFYTTFDLLSSMAFTKCFGDIFEGEFAVYTDITFYSTPVFIDICQWESSNVWGTSTYIEFIDEMAILPLLSYSQCFIEEDPINNVNFSTSYITDTFNWNYAIWSETSFKEININNGVLDSYIFKEVDPDYIVNFEGSYRFKMEGQSDVATRTLINTHVFIDTLGWWGSYNGLWFTGSYYMKYNISAPLTTSYIILTNADISWGSPILFTTWSLPAITWDTPFTDVLGTNITWDKVYTEHVGVNIVIDTLAFIDTIRWEDYLFNSSSVFSDTFNVNRTKDFEYVGKDTFDWVDFVYSKIFTDNNETTFIPYFSIAWKTYSDIIYFNYISQDVWEELNSYGDSFEPPYSDFNDAPSYMENFEYMTGLNHILSSIYTFELVTWDEVSIYIENFEYLPKFNYFDPFEEDFNWEPSISYDLNSINYNFEIYRAYELIFSEIFKGDEWVDYVPPDPY